MFITNHAVMLYETTQWHGTDPRVNTKPNTNICHTYDRRPLIMVHTSAYTQEKSLEEEKPINTLVVGSQILRFQVLVISLVALLLSKYLQCVCITFIIRKDNHKEKRLFSLRSEVLLWSESPAPQLGLCSCWLARQFSGQELCP